MRDVNSVTFSGRLGAEPEMRYTPDGTAVTNFRFAVGTGKDSVIWFDVAAWGNEAENVNKYLGKGSYAVVDGYLKEDVWETESGERRSKIKIVARFVHFGPRTSAAESSTAR